MKFNAWKWVVKLQKGQNMEAKLIKTDRNGSKHYEGMIECDRCFGKGYYAIGVLNGQPVLSPHDAGVCYKCNGKGKVRGKWIERTPEYQSKLDARRKAKWEAQQAKIDAERLEAKRIEEEEKQRHEAIIKAQKAISQHVGCIGERITIKGSYVKSAWFDVPSFKGFGTETRFIHTFKDSNGNVCIWRTSSGIDLNYGECVVIKGTVKEHSEYQEEKQTVLTRCKISIV